MTDFMDLAVMILIMAGILVGPVTLMFVLMRD